jgi:Domain of unknown function (DUF4111)
MGNEGDIIARVVDRYLELVDVDLPGRVQGLYLVGSVSYGDFWPDERDIDFVAVGAERFTSDDLAVLARVHEQLGRDHPRPHFDGFYTTWDDLRRYPDDLDNMPSAHEGQLSEGRPTVIEWGTLRTSRPMRGEPITDGWHDEQAIRDYSLQNLVDYWQDRWLRQQRGRTPAAAMSLSDWGVHWGVLGVPRLHYSVATGEITSKTGGGEYALKTFEPRWEKIVREALRIRRGEGNKSLYRTPLARRRDALAFQEHVIADGVALP